MTVGVDEIFHKNDEDDAREKMPRKHNGEGKKRVGGERVCKAAWPVSGIGRRSQSRVYVYESTREGTTPRADLLT